MAGIEETMIRRFLLQPHVEDGVRELCRGSAKVINKHGFINVERDPNRHSDIWPCDGREEWKGRTGKRTKEASMVEHAAKKKTVFKQAE
jgi:hypothetical protein